MGLSFRVSWLLYRRTDGTVLTRYSPRIQLVWRDCPVVSWSREKRMVVVSFRSVGGAGTLLEFDEYSRFSHWTYSFSRRVGGHVRVVFAIVGDCDPALFGSQPAVHAFRLSAFQFFVASFDRSGTCRSRHCSGFHFGEWPTGLTMVSMRSAKAELYSANMKEVLDRRAQNALRRCTVCKVIFFDGKRMSKASHVKCNSWQGSLRGEVVYARMS